jgi:aerobic carbon-monoxide dehydrogenase medium subunit
MIAFVEPDSLEQAVSDLEHYAGDARLVAGSTALSLLLRNGLIQPRALISLGRLRGLDTIQHEAGSLRLGALLTHRQVETSAAVRGVLPALAETFGKVANVRVRNAATVGGVLAEADYASDPPPALLALDATLEVHGPGGTRTLPVDQFFRGFYETALEPSEVLDHVRIPLPPAGTAAAYEKFVTRSSEDRPCVGVFAAIRLQADKRTCAELRVAVGAASETPCRFPDVEALAHGQPVETDLLRSVADAYAARIDTLSDLRGSAWYRTEMIRVWVKRAIEHALRRARGDEA